MSTNPPMAVRTPRKTPRTRFTAAGSCSVTQLVGVGARAARRRRRARRGRRGGPRCARRRRGRRRRRAAPSSSPRSASGAVVGRRLDRRERAADPAERCPPAPTRRPTCRARRRRRRWRSSASSRTVSTAESADSAVVTPWPRTTRTSGPARPDGRRTPSRGQEGDGPEVGAGANGPVHGRHSWVPANHVRTVTTGSHRRSQYPATTPSYLSPHVVEWGGRHVTGPEWVAAPRSAGGRRAEGAWPDGSRCRGRW